MVKMNLHNSDFCYNLNLKYIRSKFMFFYIFLRNVFKYLYETKNLISMSNGKY